MRWILLLLALIGFTTAFSTKSPGLMGIGLFVGFICLVGGFFAFAAARISDAARPDAAMLTDQDINVLKASLRKPAAPPQSSPPERA
jgi:hypothetical protein